MTHTQILIQISAKVLRILCQVLHFANHIVKLIKQLGINLLTQLNSTTIHVIENFRETLTLIIASTVPTLAGAAVSRMVTTVTATFTLMA